MQLVRRIVDIGSVALLVAGCGPGAPSPGPGTGDADSDGDGILDVHESTEDADGDGRAAYLDVDSDDDGVPDSVEAGDDDIRTPPVDSDQDRIPDTEDVDSDGNGILDTEEAFRAGGGLRDADGDGIIDSSDLDDDGDSVPDVLEVADGRDLHSGGSPRPDRLDPDCDGDGIGDRHEAWCAGTQGLCDTDGDDLPDLRDDDSDGDGISDAEEGNVGTGGVPRDLDRDGLPDFRDTDRDGDGMSDADEAAGMSDENVWDTDGDGLSDGVEQALGFDPTDPDSRWDGPIVEARPRFDGTAKVPLALDSGQVDIVFSLLHYKTDVFPPAVFEVVLGQDWGDLDLAIAASTIGTYGELPFGCRSDLFACGWTEDNVDRVDAAQVAVWARSLLSRDVERVREEVLEDGGRDPWWAYNGGFYSQTTHEYLTQIATGRGYDLDCDGTFDEFVDLAPWPRHADDLFSGTGLDANPRYRDRIGPVGTLGLRERSAKIIIVVGAGPAGFVSPAIGETYDPLGDSSLDVFYRGPSGMCPGPATHEVAVEALREVGMDLILPPRYDCERWSELTPSWEGPDDTVRDCALWPNTLSPSVQYHRIAAEIGSTWDPDGDGVAEPYTYGTPKQVAELLWFDGSNKERAEARLAFFQRELPPLLDHLLANRVDPKVVDVAVADDPSGFITGITPSRFEDPALGDVLDVSLEHRGAVPPIEADQAFVVTLEAVGDERVLLGQQDVLILVPGWGRPAE